MIQKRKFKLEYQKKKDAESDDEDHNYCCVLEPKKDEEEQVKGEDELPTHIKYIPDKYTFTQ